MQLFFTHLLCLPSTLRLGGFVLIMSIDITDVHYVPNSQNYECSKHVKIPSRPLVILSNLSVTKKMVAYSYHGKCNTSKIRCTIPRILFIELFEVLYIEQNSTTKSIHRIRISWTVWQLPQLERNRTSKIRCNVLVYYFNIENLTSKSAISYF